MKNNRKNSASGYISVGDILPGRVKGGKKKFQVKILNTDLTVPIRRRIDDREQLQKWRDDKTTVILKILSMKHISMYGEIIGTLDGSKISEIILEHGIIADFPENVRRTASKIETSPDAEEVARRIDRRNLKVVTIDGEDSKDLDDGVFAEKVESGYFLGVYIADVSHYVKNRSVLDKEAFKRGTSIYPVGRVVPMLPVELSNGICSLNPGVERLAMACEMFLDFSGNVKSYKIFPTVIKVFRRLSYTQVNKFLDGDTTNLENCKDNLNILYEIYKLRQKVREERGAINFELPEIEITLGKKEIPIKISKKFRGVAECIIEECMLVANETVAEHTFKNKIPSLYRVHEKPTDEKIEIFNRLLNRFSLHIPTSSEIQPAQFQKIINQIKNLPAEKIVSTFALRTMQQARYSPKNLGHFGIAAQFYTHFTSPIRRYPDLIVHRMLKASPDELPKLAKRLWEISIQSSKCERRAVEIERDILDYKIVEFMKGFIDQIFDAVISGITNFGFFVELENGVEGLVHISTIGGDYYRYAESEFALIGERTGRTFSIGDSVRVRLTKADRSKRQLDFELVEGVTTENLIVEVN